MTPEERKRQWATMVRALIDSTDQHRIKCREAVRKKRMRKEEKEKEKRDDDEKV